MSAYEWAYDLGITTLFPLANANPEGELLRSDLAKIAVVFANKILKRKPDTSKDCSAFSQSIQEYRNTDLHDFMIQACQLGVM